MKIIVSGMRDAGNIRDVAALGVDYIALDFNPKSPRVVTMTPTHAGIIPDKASPTRGKLGGTAMVGVFVDEMPQNIITRVVNFGLDVVRLDGSEMPTLIRNLRHTLDPDLHPGLQIWKTIVLPASADRDACREVFAFASQYESCVDALRFVIRSSGEGGSGGHSDWSVLDDYDGPLPFILSGAIGPDDATRIRTYSHSRCMGFDLDSRFETTPGMMDVQELKSFTEQLKR